MPSDDRRRRQATYQDLLQVPDTLVAEIVDGELFASPRPAPRHAWVTTALLGDLEAPFNRGRGGPGGWTILIEPELHLGADILVPDLAGWRLERQPHLPDEAYFSLPPDWLCEVLSLSTGRLDRLKKLPVYAREGVSSVWLVDPLQQTLEVLQLECGHWVVAGTHGGQHSARIPPFDAIAIELRWLWPDAFTRSGG